MTPLSPHRFVPREDGKPGCALCGRRETAHVDGDAA